MNRSSNLTVIGLAALAAIVVVVVIVVIASGGDDESTVASGPEATGGNPEAIALFSDTCGQCHTLTVAGTDGDVGPNLDDIAFDRERVLSAIENGAGNGAMAAGLLEGEDAEMVADLIAGDDPLLAEPEVPGEK